MPKTSTTTVNVSSNNQYQTTIPKPLAEAMDMENGTEITWKVTSGSKLEIEIE